MILKDQELVNFITSFQTELIDRDIPLFGISDNKLTEYEFREYNGFKLFTMDVDSKGVDVIEIDVYESKDLETGHYLTNIICTLEDEYDVYIKPLFAHIIDSETFKEYMKKKGIKVFAKCECGFESKPHISFVDTCLDYPTDICPNCGEHGLDIIYSDNDAEFDFKNFSFRESFNNLSLNEKISLLKSETNCLISDGSEVKLLESNRPTITFVYCDETYDIEDITICEDETILVEYRDDDDNLYETIVEKR